jgi:hypothetical protein
VDWKKESPFLTYTWTQWVSMLCLNHWRNMWEASTTMYAHYILTSALDAGEHGATHQNRNSNNTKGHSQCPSACKETHKAIETNDISVHSLCLTIRNVGLSCHVEHSVVLSFGTRS